MKLKNVKLGKVYEIKFVNPEYHMNYLEVGDKVEVTSLTYELPDNIQVQRLSDTQHAYVSAECLKSEKIKIGDCCELLEGFDGYPCMGGFHVGDKVEVIGYDCDNPKWQVRRKVPSTNVGWTYKKFLKKIGE